MNLVTTVILVAHHQAFQITCDVIRSPRIHVPIRIYTVRTGSGRRCTLLWRSIVVGVEPLVAAMSGMSFFATNLAEHTWLEVATVAAAPIAAAAATAAAAAISTAKASMATTSSLGGVGAAVPGGGVCGVTACRWV